LKARENIFVNLRHRVADKVSDPKVIMDIVDAGIKDPWLATNAIAEVLEQLYN